MSEIRANTISDAAGTGPATLTGQSAAKAWVNFNGTGTIAARDSFNVASLTDNGTSDYTVNWSSSFGNANYNFTFGGNVADGVVVATNTSQAAPTVSALIVRSYNASWIGVDGSYVNLSINGDLA